MHPRLRKDIWATSPTFSYWVD